MDERFLREHASRCRSLAAKADVSTERRLLALAERIEHLLKNEGGQAAERSPLASRSQRSSG